MSQYEASSSYSLLVYARKKLERSSLHSSLINLIMTHSGEIVEVHSTGEEYAYSEERFSRSEIRTRRVLACRAFRSANVGSIYYSIADFLAKKRPESRNEIVKIARDLNSFSFQNFEEVSCPRFRSFLFDGYSENNNLSTSHENNSATRVLLFGLLDVSFSKLGAEGTFKLLNEVVDLYLKGYFNDAKYPFEAFLKAILYCEDNSDYPIEWALETAFSD